MKSELPRHTQRFCNFANRKYNPSLLSCTLLPSQCPRSYKLCVHKYQKIFPRTSGQTEPMKRDVICGLAKTINRMASCNKRLKPNNRPSSYMIARSSTIIGYRQTRSQYRQLNRGPRPVPDRSLHENAKLNVSIVFGSDEGRVRSSSTPCSSPLLRDPFGPFLLSALRFRDCQSLPTLLCSSLRFPEIAGYLQPCSAQTSASPRLRRCTEPLSAIRHPLCELSHRRMVHVGSHHIWKSLARGRK